MSSEYNLDKMSTDTRAVCERGKFFIETGTAVTFNGFLQSARHIRRKIPHAFLEKIEDLINDGEKDRAITLWIRACQMSDIKTTNRKRTLLFLISYFVVAVMALYAFFKVI